MPEPRNIYKHKLTNLNMKKGVSVFILLSIFLISFAIAADEEVVKSVDDAAYDCLRERFDQTDCDSLSTEGRIFALLTLGECRDEVLDDPSYLSNIKLTSQAMLALHKVGEDITESRDWLWAQNRTPSDMIWYLQIDSTEATACEISYGSLTSTINIGEDKKIDSNAGSCLTRATGNYWLQISQSCYNQEFEISCDKDFLTTLLFKSPSENTIHVSSSSTSSQAGGTTIEKINFLCFQAGGNCDYQGTLWATLVLNYIGTKQDLSPIDSYLTTLYDLYPQYFPEAFLYYLTGANNFENELIQSQSPAGFWKVAGNKYYDTALAMLAVPSGSAPWSEGIQWLEDEQGEAGCWNSNNFVDTAFILYSVWPRGVSLSDANGNIIDTTGEYCEDAGYFCMPGASCGGSILDSYDCVGFDKCCSEEQTLETCDDLLGNVCSSNEKCVGGTSESTFDLEYGQTCCIDGACEEKETTDEFTCESNGGTCRIGDCESGEESSFDTCEFNDNCCIPQTSTESNYLWVWILLLLILISLVSVGIVKKDKVREYWFRLKSKFSKAPPTTPGVGRPITQMGPPKGIIPGRRPPMRRPSRIARPSSKAPNEINDVLKKLKDMGK